MATHAFAAGLMVVIWGHYLLWVRHTWINPDTKSEQLAGAPQSGA